MCFHLVKTNYVHSISQICRKNMLTLLTSQDQWGGMHVPSARYLAIRLLFGKTGPCSLIKIRGANSVMFTFIAVSRTLLRSGSSLLLTRNYLCIIRHHLQNSCFQAFFLNIIPTLPCILLPTQHFFFQSSVKFFWKCPHLCTFPPAASKTTCPHGVFHQNCIWQIQGAGQHRHFCGLI